MLQLKLKLTLVLGVILVQAHALQHCLVNDYNSVTPYFATNTNSSNNTLTLVNCKIETELIENDPVTNICNHVMPNGTVTVPVFVLTIRNDTIGADKSFYSICRNGGSGILSWISWSVYQKYFGNSEVFEGHSFIGRIKIEVPVEETGSFDVFNSTDATPYVPNFSYEYCTVDLLSGRCLSVITKNVMELSNDTEMLIEKLPIFYELHFIEYNPWRNVTKLRTETVGSGTISNSKTFIKYEEIEVPYNYIEQYVIEAPKYFVRNAPVDVYANGSLVNNFVVGRGKYVPVNGTLTAVRKIPALRAVDVHVRGTVIQEVITFKSELIIVYDRVRVPATDNGFQFSGTVVRTTVSNLELSYDDFYDIILFPTHQPPVAEETTSTTDSVESDEDTTSPWVDVTAHPDLNRFTHPTNPPNGVYPGFRSLAIICSIIVFSLILIVATDVSRKLLRSRREKLQQRMDNSGKSYVQVPTGKIY